MIEEIKTFRWPHFKGETTWVRCFAHTLNLIAQVVLRPFRSHKSKKKSASNVESNPNSDNDESDEEDLEDCEEQIGLFMPLAGSTTTQDSKEDGNNKEGDGDDDDNCSTINDSALAAELVNDDKVELEHDDVNNLSDEDEYN
ncbi:hypothetical protein Pst134EA_002900 [Puccinia striiformis f. sp. tritici]|uniref:hypothetical protein n=1 Tax=Puccinia striiformis f. sp. tritici TaxID=168172 RepID=UPI002007CDFD|nr:hypothetical protein Pst134EA_002900 [Puccinia striiformis f. sp. tritici]KAH9472277.1 hypothetical protein Pst134EA_002900 [Puccinia striiformis f. sp. tritici]